MRNIIEKLKDVLYDAMDYIMIIIVIAVVALVINWRLGEMFAKDAMDVAFKELPEIAESGNEEPNHDIDIDPDDITAVDPIEEEQNQDVTNAEETEIPDGPVQEPVNEVVEITIPSGSAAAKIGDILSANGLVSDSKQFVQKAVALKMDTKLKSGIFKIAKNSSIEQVLSILTK